MCIGHLKAVVSLPAPVDDVGVVGAGCIGASTALHLARAGIRVTVYEKEPGPAWHQSGRNSGVIHAGYNLKPGSAKARFCVQGSRQMRAYCRERGVALQENGILVVASRDAQLPSIERLLDNSRANGVEAHYIAGDEIASIEPHTVGVGALHAPEGASVDPHGYVQALVADARAAGARFAYGARIKDLDDLPEKVIVNAAGLHADRLAAAAALDVRVIPFRGYYARLRRGASHLVQGHVYAAPDPDFPFLGVHLSRRHSGTVTVGPGAMLAFGREAYRFAGVNMRDLVATLGWPGFWALLKDPAFRTHIGSEVAKSLSTRAIWKEARDLVPGLRRSDIVRTGTRFAGNRAQLVDKDGRLVDDIVVRETERMVHVLNAVSPGLTCSLPFGERLAGLAAAKL